MGRNQRFIRQIFRLMLARSLIGCLPFTYHDHLCLESKYAFYLIDANYLSRASPSRIESQAGWKAKRNRKPSETESQAGRQMKILSIKLLLLLIGLGVIAPMFIRGLDGEPIMTLDDWVPHSLIRWSENTIDGLGSWGDALSSETPLMHHSPPAVIGAGAEIYTWRDNQGVLHFSDTPVEGAEVTLVPHDGLAIPAEKFIQDGLSPAEPVSSSTGPRAFLLEEQAFSNRNSAFKTKKKAEASAGGATLADIEAMANGDMSKLGAVLKDLPQLVEQAKQARQNTSIDQKIHE